MKRFLGYFLAFLLAVTVAVPVTTLAVPDTAEAMRRERLPQNWNRIRQRVNANNAWNWAGPAQNTNFRDFTFPNSFTRTSTHLRSERHDRVGLQREHRFYRFNYTFR